MCVLNEKLNMSHHHPENETPTWGIRLLITLILNLLITVAEIIGGLISGSLALISDALHNLSDAVAIIISYIAIRIGKKPNSPQHTFGMKRAQILAAIINAGALVGISIYLVIEAVQRLFNPEPIQAGIMLVVAGIGLAANTLGTILLSHGKKESLNIRSAYLHLFSDAVSSLGVILGGLAIYLWDVFWVDATLTILISIYICLESIKILWESTRIIMMAAPTNLSLEKITADLNKIDGIRNVHHVHLWQMNEQDIHFEAHVDIEDQLISNTGIVLERITHLLEEDFAITHITIQFECGQCDEDESLVHQSGQ